MSQNTSPAAPEPPPESTAEYHHPALPGNAIGAREGCNCIGCQVMRDMEKPAVPENEANAGFVDADRDEQHVRTGDKNLRPEQAELAEALREMDSFDPSNTPVPAPAYRLLETGEIIQEGDEFLDAGAWYRSGAAGARVSGEPNTYRRPITGGAGLHEAATCDQSAPVSPKLSVLLAAAEGVYLCFHVDSRGQFCCASNAWHETPGRSCDHPFVSLSTLLSSVAALASETGKALRDLLIKADSELDEARTSDPALLAAARYSEEKAKVELADCQREKSEAVAIGAYLIAGHAFCPVGCKIVLPGDRILADDVDSAGKPVPEGWVGYAVRANAVPVFRPGPNHPTRIDSFSGLTKLPSPRPPLEYATEERLHCCGQIMMRRLEVLDRVMTECRVCGEFRLFHESDDHDGRCKRAPVTSNDLPLETSEAMEATFSGTVDPKGAVCPGCGAKEIPAMTPRTVYDCGSSDYDGMPGSFHPGSLCKISGPTPQQARDDAAGNPVLPTEPSVLRVQGGTTEFVPVEDEQSDGLLGFEATGPVARLSALEECGLLLSELPPAEARVVIAALATVFSV